MVLFDLARPLPSQHRIEDGILSVIAKIKKDRNRASMQNIHTFINRRGINIEMENLQKKVDSLISRNVIVDKGKKDKEPFFVAEKPSSEVDKDLDVEVELRENIKNENTVREYDLNALQDFIDEKFIHH